MPVCEADDVFEFMGVPSAIRDNNMSAINALIANMTTEFENRTSRKITKYDFSNVLFHDGLNCTICGEQMFLRGIYRDMFSITSIYETGTQLTAVTDYSDGKDYYLDTRLGMIIRNDQDWSTENFAIKITGSTGLVNSSAPYATKYDIKQCIIEMVAAKSGLWKHNISTSDGTITQVRTSISEDAKTTLARYSAK